MKLHSAAIAALCFLLQLRGNEAACTDVTYKAENVAYFENLGRILEAIYAKLKEGDAENYLRAMEGSFATAFNGSSCQYTPSPAGVSIVEANQDIVAFLETYKYDGAEISLDVREAVAKAQTLLRTLLRHRSFARCYVTKLRNSIMDNVIDCVNEKMPDGKLKVDMDTNGLTPIALPEQSLLGSGSEPPTDFEKKIYALMNIFIQGYLQIANCEAKTEIVGKLTKALATNPETELEGIDNVCEATEALEQCICQFKEKCPFVIECFKSLADDFKEKGEEIFSLKKAAVWGIKCNREAAEQKESGAPDYSGIKDLIKAGSKLFKDIKKLTDEAEQTSPAKLRQLGLVIKSVIKANFLQDSCGCEHEDSVAARLEQCTADA